MRHARVAMLQKLFLNIVKYPLKVKYIKEMSRLAFCTVSMLIKQKKKKKKEPQLN